MESVQLSVLVILGILVLVTYYFYLLKDSTKGYLDHPFWFDTPQDVVKVLIVFQILAVIGFIVAIGSWLVTPPKTGIMKDNMLFFTLCLFLISAIIWPLATYYDYPVTVVVSLILTAIASILLLAGTIEEENVQWYRVLGILCLCITTVLGDGVLWNANYIIQKKKLVEVQI